MKRVLLALLLLGAAVQAHAVDWTGLWNSPDPNKQGFGYNFVQADDYIFGTFYVYGPSSAPTWLVAGLTLDAAGNYTGDVFAVQSATFYGSLWNPAAYMPYSGRVGTASFIPSKTNNYQGTLMFTVTQANVGIGSSTVAIERQFLGTIATGGDYYGGQYGAYTGCTDATLNGPYGDSFDLTITHLSSGSATFAFVYASQISTGEYLTCTLAGTYVQHGQYYEIPSAAYTCNDGLSTTAKMTEIMPTSLGIEGRFSAPNVGGGCAENANFAAVLK